MPKVSVMKNIALLVPSFEGGGAEKVIVTLANSFYRAGYVVTLLAVSSSGPLKEELLKGVDVVDFARKRASFALPQLCLYLWRERPACVLTTMYYMNIILIIAKIITFTNSKIIIREANTLSKTIGSTRLLPATVRKWVFTKLYGLADHIIAPSYGVASDLRESIGMKKLDITVLYNPVDIDDILLKAAKPVVCEWINDSSSFVFVAVGSLTPQKDHASLLRAFKKASESTSANIKLLILGKGRLESELDKLIIDLNLSENCKLLGFVENPFNYVASADCFVLSSRWEGMPNALIQAMVVGVPCISADCDSGPREILENGRWGELVQVGDVDGLSKALVRQSKLTNRTKNTELFLFCKKRFGVSEISKKYISLILSR